MTDEQDMLEDLKRDLIDRGFRELVDTMDYIESRARDGDVTSLEEAVDVRDFPISDGETTIFLSGISFGVLLYKIMTDDPVGMDVDPPDHLLRRWDEAAVQTILVPEDGELSIVGIDQSKMITEGEKIECICDEEFFDETEALEHVS